ncbi:MAG TPA: hypothetical protein VJ801_11240 [Polyangia bacterium]|jgi:hypothetical protein|nr:hypothetical protein [Polyangia bacterium]
MAVSELDAAFGNLVNAHRNNQNILRERERLAKSLGTLDGIFYDVDDEAEVDHVGLLQRLIWTEVRVPSLRDNSLLAQILKIPAASTAVVENGRLLGNHAISEGDGDGPRAAVPLHGGAVPSDL